MVPMAGLKSKVQDQDKKNFVRRVLREKMDEYRRQFRSTKYDTEVCVALGKEIGLSGATLMNARIGDFTIRTVNKMKDANWFTASEYLHAGRQQDRRNEQVSKNDMAAQQAREKGQWSRGYDQGRADGFRAGKEAVKQQAESAVKGAIQAAYDRGYRDGLRDGARAKSMRRGTMATPSGMPMDRLRQLFNMNSSRGAVQGEVVAARKAAGKTLARWIKDQFGQDVEVDIK